jgi:hypothetical protein
LKTRIAGRLAEIGAGFARGTAHPVFLGFFVNAGTDKIAL